MRRFNSGRLYPPRFSLLGQFDVIFYQLSEILLVQMIFLQRHIFPLRNMVLCVIISCF